MTVSSSNLSTPENACATRLLYQSNRGSLDLMPTTLADYLGKHGKTDPFGRLALSLAMRDPHPYSVEMLSDVPELAQKQHLDRWRAWQKLLPLDMQLKELGRADIGLLLSSDWSLLKWEQWDGLKQAVNLDQAFWASPLGGWLSPTEPGPGSPFTHRSGTASGYYGRTAVRVSLDASGMLEQLIQASHQLASRIMAVKAWDRLDEWMGMAGIQACHPLKTAHFYDSHAFLGAGGVDLPEPLPFWCQGLFVGAWEDGFWDTMKRHGGPSDRGQLREMTDFLAHPLSRIVDEGFGRKNEIRTLVIETAARWRQEMLDHALRSVSLSPKRSRL